MALLAEESDEVPWQQRVEFLLQKLGSLEEPSPQPSPSLSSPRREVWSARSSRHERSLGFVEAAGVEFDIWAESMERRSRSLSQIEAVLDVMPSIPPAPLRITSGPATYEQLADGEGRLRATLRHWKEAEPNSPVHEKVRVGDRTQDEQKETQQEESKEAEQDNLLQEGPKRRLPEPALIEQAEDPSDRLERPAEDQRNFQLAIHKQLQALEELQQVLQDPKTPQPELTRNRLLHPNRYFQAKAAEGSEPKQLPDTSPSEQSSPSTKLPYAAMQQHSPGMALEQKQAYPTSPAHSTSLACSPGVALENQQAYPTLPAHLISLQQQQAYPTSPDKQPVYQQHQLSPKSPMYQQSSQTSPKRQQTHQTSPRQIRACQTWLPQQTYHTAAPQQLPGTASQLPQQQTPQKHLLYANTLQSQQPLGISPTQPIMPLQPRQTQTISRDFSSQQQITLSHDSSTLQYTPLNYWQHSPLLPDTKEPEHELGTQPQRRVQLRCGQARRPSKSPKEASEEDPAGTDLVPPGQMPHIEPVTHQAVEISASPVSLVSPASSPWQLASPITPLATCGACMATYAKDTPFCQACGQLRPTVSPQALMYPPSPDNFEQSLHWPLPLPFDLSKAEESSSSQEKDQAKRRKEDAKRLKKALDHFEKD